MTTAGADQSMGLSASKFGRAPAKTMVDKNKPPESETMQNTIGNTEKGTEKDGKLTSLTVKDNKRDPVVNEDGQGEQVEFGESSNPKAESVEQQ